MTMGYGHSWSKPADRAGLERRRKPEPSRRYDPNNNAAGQIKDPNKPLIGQWLLRLTAQILILFHQ